MNKKLYLIVMVLVILSMAFAGCTRSATDAKATATPAVPFPVVSDAERLTEIVSMTQAAEAIKNTPAPQIATPTVKVEGGQAEPTAAPVVAEATATVTAAPVAAFVPTPGRPATYTLQKGEWPLCIARRYNLDVNAFFSLNGLSMASKPATGTVVKIPTGGSWSSGDRALKSHPATYTVVSGDTIYTIACAYGDVDPNAIIAVNSLKDPYTLTAGQKLSIP